VLMFALLLGLEILFLIFLKSLYDLANPQVWGALFRAHVCAADGSGDFVFDCFEKFVRFSKSSSVGGPFSCSCLRCCWVRKLLLLGSETEKSFNFFYKNGKKVLIFALKLWSGNVFFSFFSRAGNFSMGNLHVSPLYMWRPRARLPW